MLALLSITAAMVIVGAAFFWRLSQGPVSLDFMTKRIEAEINKSLSGMSVKMGGAIFELDPKTSVPHFRLRDIVLLDQSGNLIARSKRAAIGFDGGALLTASLVPQELELIGSRIFIKRQLDGGLALGFGSPPAAEDEVVTMEGTSGEEGGSKDNRENQQSIATSTNARSLIDILSGNGAASSVSSLKDIRITDASIQLFDEANQSNWFAPEADLTFRRMPYGFVVFAKAAVASGASPWRTEISANYRTESKSFAVSARIEDLVPANVSDKIFALAQFARVNVPLSGHAEFEVNDQGVVTQATAEFAAAAGVVGLPEYIAQPIVIDEGALRVDYDPVEGGFNIVDSIILVGGSRAELTGRVDPVRAPDGKLTDFRVDLKATNVSVDTLGTVKNPVLVDKVEFKGKASVEGASLDIEDLVVMSGNAGVRLRGEINGGDESAGIVLQGRVRDISADFLKKLWPPIVAPKSRKWVTENVVSGRITEGTFGVDIPVNGLADALRNKILPDNNIDFQFSMADVTSAYFRDMPPLQSASGSAHLTGDNFDLAIDAGQVTLPSNGQVQVRKTTFKATKLLADEVPGEISLNLTAKAPELLEMAALPNLNLVKNAGFAMPNLEGDANAFIELRLPLVKDVPRGRVRTKATIKFTNATIKQIIPKIDLTEGQLDVSIDPAGIEISGPVKLNGFPAQVTWQRAKGPNSKSKASIISEFDGNAREKLGINLDGFLAGPIKVSADISGVGEKTSSIEVRADLSKADLHLDAISWYRPHSDDTTASFTYSSSEETGRRVDNLVVKGQGFSLKGDVLLKPDGSMKSANFSQVWLSEENNFSMTVEPSEQGQSIGISGKAFDARPIIKSMFSKNVKPTASSAPKQNLKINAQVERVIANRGEVLTGVAASLVVRNSAVATAEIRGKFLSGQTLVMHVKQSDAGRLLQVNSNDAGAALRASNLYSKVSGGQLEFAALLSNDASSTVQNGRLIMRDFDVRNEAALATIDSRGKAKKSGPRREGLSFKKLTMPFTTDAKFIRIGDSLVRGNELGASAEGLIRKSDGAIDITGTMIPAYGLNAAVGKIPLFGDILTGGKGQGVFGLTFALSGTMANPKFQVNPISALAPGILRKFFEYDGSGKPIKMKEPNTR